MMLLIIDSLGGEHTHIDFLDKETKHAPAYVPHISDGIIIRITIIIEIIKITLAI